MRRLVLAALILLASAISAQAQTYPAKLVRVIVPAAPGGSLDIVARVLTAKLADMWGQPVVVENRPGNNFILGTDAVVKSAPDGYTLLYVASGALTINPVIFSNLPYDSQKDLAPITLINISPYMLLVNNDVPAKTVQDFVSHLKANPGKLNHASNSAITILMSELLKSLTRADYVDVNYKGAVLAATATSTGETQFCFVDKVSGGSAVRAGRVRALAVTSSQRDKQLPDVPTMAEAGLAGFSVAAWHVLLAPSKTPPELIARINGDVGRALALQEVVSRVEAAGAEVVGGSPELAAKELQVDMQRWRELVKQRNIKLQ
jgi:tripartite-type tricarboxylate transporter receptor subunit TctC